jgi:hypothetical protein
MMEGGAAHFSEMFALTLKELTLFLSIGSLCPDSRTKDSTTPKVKSGPVIYFQRPRNNAKNTGDSTDKTKPLINGYQWTAQMPAGSGAT